MNKWKSIHFFYLGVGMALVVWLSRRDDPFIPSEETPTSIHGVPKRDPNRVVYKFDYENNKWIYDKHDLDPQYPVNINYEGYRDMMRGSSKSKNKHKNTIKYRIDKEDQLENTLDDYIWDNYDDVLDRIK